MTEIVRKFLWLVLGLFLFVNVLWKIPIRYERHECVLYGFYINCLDLPVCTERGVCLPTVSLWILFVYIEAAIRFKDLKDFHVDLCRPFAAHW